jgi:hypothetical protein
MSPSFQAMEERGIDIVQESRRGVANVELVTQTISLRSRKLKALHYKSAKSGCKNS